MNDLQKHSFPHKLKYELLGFLTLSGYFAVFFMAITYLKFSVLQKVGIPFTGFGLGLLRAIICAKFMMLGKALFPVKTRANQALIHHIFNRSLVYLFFTLLLNVLEEVVMAKIHGVNIQNAVIGVAPGTINQFCAITILYWFMLIPYVTFSAINHALGGEGRLYNLIFVKTDAAS